MDIHGYPRYQSSPVRYAKWYCGSRVGRGEVGQGLVAVEWVTAGGGDPPATHSNGNGNKLVSARHPQANPCSGHRQPPSPFIPTRFSHDKITSMVREGEAKTSSRRALKREALWRGHSSHTPTGRWIRMPADLMGLIKSTTYKRGPLSYSICRRGQEGSHCALLRSHCALLPPQLERMVPPCKCGSPRGLFAALCIGGCISSTLMVLSMWLTERQKVYSDAIINVGRVQYLLQRYTELVLVERVDEFLNRRNPDNPDAVTLGGYSKSSPVQVLEDVTSICNQLLGEVPHVSAKYQAPKIPDANVRREFQAWWMPVLLSLSEAHSDQRYYGFKEYGNILAKTIEAVNDLDVIATALSREAQDHLKDMLGIHVIRLITQSCFYTWLAMLFKWIWIPFVKIFNDRQRLQLQQDSLLRSDFDAIVEISAVAPFVVRRSTDVLDEIVDKSMLGESILDAASTEDSREALRAFLIAGVSHGLQTATLPPDVPGIFNRMRDWCRSISILAWPRLELSTKLQKAPLAPKINSQWNCDVEIFIVGGSEQCTHDSLALLAVRRLSPGLTGPRGDDAQHTSTWDSGHRRVSSDDVQPNLVGSPNLEHDCHLHPAIRMPPRARSSNRQVLYRPLHEKKTKSGGGARRAPKQGAPSNSKKGNK